MKGLYPTRSWNEIAKVGVVPIYQAPGLLAWQGGLSIDDDGDPGAYNPKDWGPLHGRAPLGRDAPENAVGSRADLSAPTPQSVTHWAGVVTGPDRQPVVQGQGDPDPGDWVSETRLQDPAYPERDPRRYVDAQAIPYLSIPALVHQLGARWGDVAVVECGELHCFAIIADLGPGGRIGEGSPALCRALGLPDNPRRGGTAAGLTTYVFCASGSGRPLPVPQIVEIGMPLYDELRQTRSI